MVYYYSKTNKQQENTLATKTRSVKQVEKAIESAKTKIVKFEAQAAELKQVVKDLITEKKAAEVVEKQVAAEKAAKAKAAKAATKTKAKTKTDETD